MKLFAIIEDTLRSRLSTIIVFLSISAFFLVIGVIVAVMVDPSKMVTSITTSQQNASQQGQTQGPGQQQGRTEEEKDPQQQQPQAPQQAPPPQIEIDLSTVPKLIEFFQTGLAGFIHFAALLLGVFATAGIIPNTLEKGTIDLFLSKPVSRAEILTGRYLGGGLIVFLNTAFFVTGAWLIISIKTGYWNTPFLAVMGTVTVSYLILAAAMMILGISTRSSAATIIIVFFFIYLVAPILQSREGFLFQLIDSEAIKSTISAIYYMLPKPGEFTEFAGKLIMHQELSWTPIWSSALFGGAMYGLSVFVFQRKDF